MKYKEHLSMSDMMNFDRDVVNYINDNREWIKSAEEAINHYEHTIEASGYEESRLSEEQRERFINVAKRLFDQGYVEHAGVKID
jgi:hypothetical protein